MSTQKNSRHNNDIPILIILLVLASLIYFKFGKNDSVQKENFENNAFHYIPKTDTSSNAKVMGPGKNDITSGSVSIPAEFNIEVPFASQAPLYNWDSLHEDACEEASLLMFKYWSQSKTITNKEAADEEIKAIVAYEEVNSYGPSISLSDLNKISQRYYKLSNLKVSEVSGVQEIKEIVAKGSPVIVGAAGKILPNPNFRNGGPNYHMLVIKGYDRDGFITNDPGTRKGENFYYTNEGLWNAIHDWNEKDILNGPKNIMFVEQDR